MAHTELGIAILIESVRMQSFLGQRLRKGNLKMKINKVYCLFEQSGTFKNQFKKLGILAEDFDILNDFGETDKVCDLFSEIRGGTRVRKVFLMI
jgi:hypothetical protein